MVILTAVIFQNILLPIVLCKYPSNRINCDEPFEFCPNKRPSNQPEPCSNNGGYPDDLTYGNTAYADYSQYRAAMALKPCFNKEMADMGFEGEDEFRTINVFTDNNIRRNRGVDNRPLSSDSFLNSDDRFSAVAIVFEEPESRKALIEYLR